MKLTANLSYKSLTQLLKDIEAYQNQLKTKCDEFAKRLAEYGSSVAGQAFNMGGLGIIPPDVTMSVERMDDGKYSIVANGTTVCFLEFGTGLYAGNPSDKYAAQMPFRVEPGSWSKEHGGTWQDWLDQGKDPNAYPFNAYPVRGMLQAYNAMVDNAERIAREVFSK